MTGAVLLGAVAAAGAAALAVPPRGQPARSPAPGPEREDPGWLLRHRLVWSVLAGFGALTFVGGALGGPAGLGAAAAVWVVIGRSETPTTRAERDAVRRDLPAVVTLLADALRAGADPGEAVRVVADALPGPAAERLAAVSARLRLGGDPSLVWSDLARDPELAALGRTMARAQATGAPVVAAVERLATDLARAARADTEDRARAVGVKAAVPLGLCLLPAFVLIGIVPLVAGLVLSLSW